MKDIIFKRTELEDKEIMTKYFDEHPSRSCERTFVNVFLWSRQYPVKWAIVEGAMVFKAGIREDSRLSMTGTKRIMSMKARS